jgi:hypothetical protein
VGRLVWLENVAAISTGCSMAGGVIYEQNLSTVETYALLEAVNNDFRLVLLQRFCRTGLVNGLGW